MLHSYPSNHPFRGTWLLVMCCVTCCMMTMINSSIVHGDESTIGFDYITNKDSIKLPMGLSDMVANVHNETNLIYITGGCNHPKGNEYNTYNSEYVCGSLSDKLYVYDPTTNQFRIDLQTTLPTSRYRHAATLINNYLWLFGGRDLEDTLISTVDVYDIEVMKWYNFTNLPLNFSTSDHTSFPNVMTNEIIVCGGYLQDYTAIPNCYGIDTMKSITNYKENSETSTNNSTESLLVFQEKGSLLFGRGDIGIAWDNEHAIVTGGFSSSNDWCYPHNDTEQYDYETDTWTAIKSLNYERGDKALVALGHHVYALGGERSISNLCDLLAANETIGPDQKRVSVDTVEMYDTDTNMWMKLEDLPFYRFRFPAVAIESLESIYAFGGQLGYNESCSCFPTTDEITILTVKSTTGTPGSGATAGTMMMNVGDGWLSMTLLVVLLSSSFLLVGFD